MASPFTRVAGFTSAPKHETREAWLQAAVDKARPMFKAAGRPLPGNVRVAVGFMAGGARSMKHLAECWSASASADGGREIWIRPDLLDARIVLGILVHELCHAALPSETGHDSTFKALGQRLLLEGKPTEMTGGAAFWERWEPIARGLGVYPHARFNAGERKKQTTRMIKAECGNCGFTFRTTRKWIAEGGDLRCPSVSCDGSVSVEE